MKISDLNPGTVVTLKPSPGLLILKPNRYLYLGSSNGYYRFKIEGSESESLYVTDKDLEIDKVLETRG